MSRNVVELKKARSAAAKPAETLTETKVGKLPTRAKVYDVRDAKVSGLMVRVTPSAVRTYYFKGRIGAGRSAQMRMLKIGRTDDISLAEARKKARQYRADMDRGIDPNAPVTGNITVADLIEKYVADLERRGVVKASDMKTSLRTYLRPYRASPVSDLSLAALTRTIEDIRAGKIRARNGGAGAAAYFRKTARSWLGWAHARGYILANPLAGYREDRATRVEILSKTKRDCRLRTPEDIRSFWSATNEVAPPRRDLLRLALILGTRRTETALIHRQEIEGDRLTVPAERAKMARDHVAPLGRLSQTIISAQPSHAGTDLLFPGRGNRPISGWSQLLRPVRHILGYPIGCHDLRRTYRWHLDRLGVSEPLAEVMIAHKRDDLTDLYSSDDALWDARVKVQDRWEAWLAEVLK
ncbi:tyrosine-type recombinase/integrase [Aliiruegeria lutimaris]|uniref:Phage integrase family protein n=1 Tax=Aliiruegeria lutimaris TaxID=571298 RepID=A0A1G9ME35_9RHOB|nr:integrase family protein [Aliiruegeria lutimaris]SDL72469.1 Phage integrase family protein [Aliiruegeria lutimaris]